MAPSFHTKGINLGQFLNSAIYHSACWGTLGGLLLSLRALPLLIIATTFFHQCLLPVWKLQDHFWIYDHCPRCFEGPLGWNEIHFLSRSLFSTTKTLGYIYAWSCKALCTYCVCYIKFIFIFVLTKHIHWPTENLLRCCSSALTPAALLTQSYLPLMLELYASSQNENNNSYIVFMQIELLLIKGKFCMFFYFLFCSEFVFNASIINSLYISAFEETVSCVHGIYKNIKM